MGLQFVKTGPIGFSNRTLLVKNYSFYMASCLRPRCELAQTLGESGLRPVVYASGNRVFVFSIDLRLFVNQYFSGQRSVYINLMRFYRFESEISHERLYL